MTVNIKKSNKNIKRALSELKCTLSKGHYNSLTGLFFEMYLLES